MGDFVMFVLVLASVVVLAALITAFSSWLYKRITWNKNAKERGWRVIPFFLAPPFGIGFDRVEQWQPEYKHKRWRNPRIVHPIKIAYSSDSPNDYTFIAGCFAGNLYAVKKRLYFIHRPKHVIAYRLFELEKLGVNTSGWPKSCEEAWENNEWWAQIVRESLM